MMTQESASFDPSAIREPILDSIKSLCDRMRSRVVSMRNIKPISTDDYGTGWDNWRYESDLIRQSHFELYTHKHLAVLHVTVFPQTTIDYPIFGFDVIANTKTNKVTAVFLDQSPVNDAEENWNWSDYKTDIELPDWATIFSDQFVASRSIENHERFFLFVDNLFFSYIQLLKYEYKVVEECSIKRIKERQTLYCQKQSQNSRTFGAIKARLGEKKATEFMEQVLFPKPL